MDMAEVDPSVKASSFFFFFIVIILQDCVLARRYKDSKDCARVLQLGL
jgi:hypothetical protein